MLILQRRPMQHEPLKPHIRPRTKLQIQTDRLARPQAPLDRGLEIGPEGVGAVVGEELEDVGADGLGLLGVARFDGEEEVEDAVRDEGDEEGGVVYDDVLEGLSVAWSGCGCGWDGRGGH